MKDETRDHVAMEQRRMEACALFKKAVRPAEVARRSGVRRQSAHAWFVKWKQGGAAALQSKGLAGRKPRLNAAQKKQVAQEIAKGATAHGYSD